MKDTFKNMLSHPIAAAVVISAITSGIAQVITAVKNKKEG
jgi:hypothetical protein